MQALAGQDAGAVFGDAVAPGFGLFGAGDMQDIAALAAGSERVEGGAELGIAGERLGQFFRQFQIAPGRQFRAGRLDIDRRGDKRPQLRFRRPDRVGAGEFQPFRGARIGALFTKEAAE